MELDTSLLNTLHEKGAFGSLSTQVANFTYIIVNQSMIRLVVNER